MIDVKIDLSDLIAKLNQIGDADLIASIARAIANEAVRPELAKYPGQTHAKQPFTSDKSRRYFFAALKEGKIQVPYQRTGALGAFANWQETPSSGGLTLTSTTDYSDLVRTKGKQAKYHKKNWDTTDQIAKRIERDIAEVIGTAAVLERLRQAGLV